MGANDDQLCTSSARVIKKSKIFANFLNHLSLPSEQHGTGTRGQWDLPAGLLAAPPSANLWKNLARVIIKSKFFATFWTKPHNFP